MKQKLSLWWTGALVASALALFASCSDDEQVEEQVVPSPAIPEFVNEEAADPSFVPMSGAEQKARIAEITSEALSYIDVNDFQYYSDLYQYVQTELMSYGNEAVSNHLIYVLAMISDWVSESHEESGTPDWLEVYDYVYYKIFVDIDKFYGHYVADPETREWSYTKANDLQIAFTDQEGKDCLLTVQTFGEKKKVHIGNITSEESSEDFTDEGYREEHQITDYDTWVNVPERLEVTYTRDQVVDSYLSLNVDLSGMEGEEIDAVRDAYSMDGYLQVGRYTLSVVRAAYSGTIGLETKAALMKDDVTVAAVNLLTTGNLLLDGVKGVKVNVDVLGKMQLQGLCSDGTAFYGYYQNAKNNASDLATVKGCVNAANEIFDMGLYFDGSPNRQSTIELCYVADAENPGCYKVEPLIYVGNTTPGITWDDFTATGFETVKAQIQGIIAGVLKLIGKA